MIKQLRFKPESSLVQQCYDQLRAEIIDGDIKPGEKLKVEPIKERFGIGQSPIREALSRLVASGLVEVEDNKGFRVARVSEDDIRDTYATFTALENLVLTQSIQRGDDAWAAHIVAELYKLTCLEEKADLVGYEEWAERNYAFHVALIAGCGSPLLLEIRKNLYMKFDRYCRMAYRITQYNLLKNNHDHQELAKAVLERNIVEACRLMERHINGALEDVIMLFKQHSLL